jgi:hypothetical protein
MLNSDSGVPRRAFDPSRCTGLTRRPPAQCPASAAPPCPVPDQRMGNEPSARARGSSTSSSATARFPSVAMLALRPGRDESSSRPPPRFSLLWCCSASYLSRARAGPGGGSGTWHSIGLGRTTSEGICGLFVIQQWIS